MKAKAQKAQINRNRLGPSMNAKAQKAKFKNPRCGQACHAKAKAQNRPGRQQQLPDCLADNNIARKCQTQALHPKQESMLATDRCTRFRRHNQLRKTSLKLRTSSSTPSVLEDFVAAGPARGLQSGNCSFTTWDFLGVRPSSFGLTRSRLNKSRTNAWLQSSHAAV